VELDGRSVDPLAIPIVDDGETHDVVVVLGRPRLAATRPADQTARA
jgi:hypothetical protein